MYEEKRVCSVCGRVIEENEPFFMYDDGTYACEDCCVYCDCCGSIIPKDEAHNVNLSGYDTGEDSVVCDDCFKGRNFTACDCCGEYYPEVELMDAHHDGDYVTICHTCRDEEYVICDACGRLVHRDDAYYDSYSEEYFCEDCYGSHGSGLIKPYHNAPPIRFYGELVNGRQHYFGFELEVDRCHFDAENERDLVDELVSIAEDRIYFERDGSLDYGFEIITHPHTLYEMRNNLHIKEILESCKKWGYTSHNNGNCGLHFHISRQFFGPIRYQDVAIKKMMYFYDTYYRDVLRFARRTSGQSRWCERNANSEYNDTLNLKDRTKKYDDLYAKHKCHDDRYFAVNTTNRDTVEIRIMRGTLNYTTFMASLDFVATIAKNAKSISWKDVNNLHKWFRGLDESTLGYMSGREAFIGLDN